MIEIFEASDPVGVAFNDALKGRVPERLVEIYDVLDVQRAFLTPDQVECVKVTGDWDSQIDTDATEHYGHLISSEIVDTLINAGVITPTDEKNMYTVNGVKTEGLKSDVYVADTADPEVKIFQILLGGRFPQL